MGYDMYLVTPPKTPEQEGVQAAISQASDDAAARRDRAADELQRTDPTAYERWRKAIFTEGLSSNAGLPDDHPLIVAQRDLLATHDAGDEERGYFRLNIWGMSTCRQVMLDRGMGYAGKTPEYPCDREALVEKLKPLLDEVRKAQRDAAPLPIDLRGGPTDPRFVNSADEALASAAADEDDEEQDLEAMIQEAEEAAFGLWPHITPVIMNLPEVIRADVEAHVRTFIAWHRDVPEAIRKPGIPFFKVGSNDGWWVTKEECAEALAIHDAWVAANGDAVPIRRPDKWDEPGTEPSPVDWWPEWIAYLRKGAAGNGFRVW